MPPGGGPADTIPPELVTAVPESASRGHGPLSELRFEFSEKMTRQDAFRWLQIYPRRTARTTRWKSAQTAVVQLETPLPPDTIVVVEILPGLKDSHGVAQPEGRQWAFATGDSLPDGEVSGHLVLEGKPLPGGVVELLPDGPDTVRLAQRPVLRRAVTDSLGAFRLLWLPAAGEKWLLRAYEDRNRDRRPGENEAVRLWPDTLSLTPAAPRLDLGIRTLYPPQAPGSLTGRLAGRPAGIEPIFAFVLKISEQDTGYVPAPQPASAQAGQAVPDTGAFTLEGAGPGLVRAVFFADRDGDSLLSVMALPGDTLWALEPWALVDSVIVEPGLEALLPPPAWPDTLTTWAQPPAAAAGRDSLAAGSGSAPGAGAADSLAADKRQSESPPKPDRPTEEP